ncbi:hypothetical protein AXF42_Ash006739 [Apostasia shenzhenica]|uniref:Uncharacterized protein n=1 Tax=Apostasia shenzhenica TaxID=1088818 RepID=A0A2I0AJ07_9ASPA|nr:hypothetical protein AXF42_Ash006739 [Apostasia shenzhenica]
MLMASSGGRWLLLLLRWLVLLLLLYTSTVTTTVAPPRPLSPIPEIFLRRLAQIAIEQYNFQNRNGYAGLVLLGVLSGARNVNTVEKVRCIFYVIEVRARHFFLNTILPGSFFTVMSFTIPERDPIIRESIIDGSFRTSPFIYSPLI